MFNRTVEDFIQMQRAKLDTDRRNMSLLLSTNLEPEKNDSGKTEDWNQNIHIEEKENIPEQQDSSSITLQSVKSNTAKKLLMVAEMFLEGKSFERNTKNVITPISEEDSEAEKCNNQLTANENVEKSENIQQTTYDSNLDDLRKSNNSGFYKISPGNKTIKNDKNGFQDDLLEKSVSKTDINQWQCDDCQPSETVICRLEELLARKKSNLRANEPSMRASDTLIGHLQILVGRKKSELVLKNRPKTTTDKFKTPLNDADNVFDTMKNKFRNLFIPNISNSESKQVNRNSSNCPKIKDGFHKFNDKMKECVVKMENKYSENNNNNLGETLNDNEDSDKIKVFNLLSFMVQFLQRKNFNYQNFPDTRTDNATHKMLKYGEYSPNNPKMRVSTQPFLGVGEYEQRKQFLLDQRKADYQNYVEKIKVPNDDTFIRNNFKGSKPVSNRDSSRDKYVQTDIKNIHTQLIQFDGRTHQEIDKKKSSLERDKARSLKIDRVKIETQNNFIIPGHSKYLDRTRPITQNSPRAKLMADLQSTYFPSAMGNAGNYTADEDKLEKARRQEKYLTELRQQIEEKQRLLEKHRQEEKLEKELEARRIEAQLRDINISDKQILPRQPYSTHSFNSREFDDKYKSRTPDTTHHLPYTDSHSSDKIALKRHSSPRISRRSTVRPPYSFNIQPNSIFAKRDNSKILALNHKLQTTTSTTTNDHQIMKPPPSVTSTNTKFDESLPIPVFKAQSPVAKELVNAVAVQSQLRTSDAMRKLEDKWQIPAVQKNIIKSSDRSSESSSSATNQGVLTQLGAIRLQLQQEQLRLDETLRKRGTSQTVQADVHHNLI